ncbi:MAG: RT0821/Lpp0805 family surface protein [Pseudomonadota bacterium]|nr:RT0821/Lpp0805 family surface protein [Pseudomonadota bacterium]
MRTLAVLVVILFSSACSSDQRPNMNAGQMVGTAVGALVGGFAGSHLGGSTGKLVFTVIGGTLGAVIGYSIGDQLMPSDYSHFEKSTRYAMEYTTDGQLHSWTNPMTGVAGTIKPLRTYYTDNNMYCRDFEATIAVNDEIGGTSAKACKAQGGGWYLEQQKV